MENKGRLAFLTTAHAFNHIFVVFFTPLLIPMADSFGITIGRLGALVAASLAAYSIGALPAGFLADLLGSRLMITLSLALPVAGCFLVSVAQGLPVLTLGLLIIGVGSGFYHPSGFAMLSAIAPSDDTGRYMGAHGAGGNAGMMLAPFVTAAVATLTGWRGAFIFWGCLGLVPVLLTWPLMGVPMAKAPQDAGVQRLTITPGLILVLALCGVHGVVSSGTLSYLPTYLQSDKGQVLFLSGVFTAFLYGCGVVGQVLGGHWTDRRGRAYPLYAGSAGAAVGLILLPVSSFVPVLLVSLLMLGVSLFVLQPPMGALLADHSSVERRGLSYGLYFSIQHALGAAAVFAAGFVADSLGLDVVFLILGAASMLALFLTRVVVPHVTLGKVADEDRKVLRVL